MGFLSTTLRWIGLACWLLFGVAASMGFRSQAAPPFLEMATSEPVRVNDLEFVTTTQAVWSNLHGIFKRSDPVEVQVWITNRGSFSVLLPLFDTFVPVLKDEEGREVRRSGGRDGTLLVKPVLIRPGATYCLCRKAELRREPGKGVYFDYFDGTGSLWSFPLSEPGGYRLSFSFSNPGEKTKPSDGIPVWSGNAVTHEAFFKLVSPPSE